MTRTLTVVGCVDNDNGRDCPARQGGLGACWCALDDSDPKSPDRDTPQDGTAPKWCPLRKSRLILELRS